MASQQSQDQRTFRVLNLKAENVRRIKAVDITPPPSGTVIVGGKNAQGKTSTLDAILMAFVGGKSDYVKAIRDGQDKARVEIDCGDFRVTRLIHRDGRQALEVRAADGLKMERPQQFLNELVGAGWIKKLAVDPLEFAKLPARERRATLLALSGIGEHLDALQRRHAILADERLTIGRQLRRAQALYESFGDLSDCPTAPLDDSELVQKISAQQKAKAETAATEWNVRNREAEVNRDRQRLAEIQEQIAQLRAQAEETERRMALNERFITNALRELEERQSEPSVDLAAELAAIRDHNAAHQRLVGAMKARAAIEELQMQYDDRSAAMDALEEDRRALLSAVTFPVPGLGFDGEDATLDGRPLSELSASETLKVSLAIAMAANPTLRVIRIMDGSLLDEDNLALIRDIAREHDYQVWIECVGERDDALVIIEDGSARAPRKTKGDHQ